MQIERPTWMLKALCPVCGQGSSLILLACPACSQLAVCCDEEGSYFRDSRDLVPVDKSSPCLGCGKHSLVDFDIATDDQIQAAGLTPAEYR